ncbi:MAG: M48 family metallopeptidase [Gallionella sp.]|nr:M48 family metallopeptidase [Gallionella sp.]
MLEKLRNLVTKPAVEQRATSLAGKQIIYTLKRSSKRRSIGLRIDHRGLTVSMPLRASEKWLDTVLQEKAQWVVEKLDGWQARAPDEVQWINGESLDYLGEQLTLRVEISLFSAPAQLRKNELWVFVRNGNEPKKIEQAVTRWYQQEALPLLKQRVDHYAPLLNVSPRTVKLSNAKTQWGCCTARGTVHLNLQLIKLPLHLIDYVVVHELAHLREMNHSAAFWQEVESVCPDYLLRRAELKSIAL